MLLAGRQKGVLSIYRLVGGGKGLGVQSLGLCIGKGSPEARILIPKPLHIFMGFVWMYILIQQM